MSGKCCLFIYPFTQEFKWFLGFSDFGNIALNCFALGHVEKRYVISQLNDLILEGNKHKSIQRVQKQKQ